MSLPNRLLGSTSVEVTAFGLGGECVLRSFGREKEAARMLPGCGAFVERNLNAGREHGPSGKTRPPG